MMKSFQSRVLIVTLVLLASARVEACATAIETKIREVTGSAEALCEECDNKV